MKIGITGASGLIGERLCQELAADGHLLTLFRRPSSTVASPTETRSFVDWDLLAGPPEPGCFDGLDALVHLAGEPIAGGRWTSSRKRRIRESRVVGTRNLVAGLKAASDPPPVLISASAVGFYGNRGDELLTEDSAIGEGYLPEVCLEWEEEARHARDLIERVVLLRTGIVLSQSGGALEKMLPPFRLGVGGRLGNGSQYMSWIHILDEVRLIQFLLDNPVSGPVNATAPNPVTNRRFTRVLADVLYRPSFCPVPGPVLRILFGEMAQALLLEGQRVVPARALEAGFEFRFSDLGETLSDLLVVTSPRSDR